MPVRLAPVRMPPFHEAAPMFWTIAAVILIPAISKGIVQARRENAAKAAAVRAAAEREAYFASLGLTMLPGTRRQSRVCVGKDC